LLYQPEAGADRAFRRDDLPFASVDAGEGGLLFGLFPCRARRPSWRQKFVQNHADENLAGRVIHLVCAASGCALAAPRVPLENNTIHE
jgi:hypothetical protein